MNSTNLTYDSNGNLTLDDLYKYKYDAENRLVELRYPNDTLIASYAYDGNSLRVVKVWGADRTFYLYAGTQLISEFEDAASNTYSAGTTPGAAPADSVSTMLYQHSDHLTTRLTTDNFGNLSNEQAHYPYGEQWYAGGTADPSVLRKFTSYQREDEATNGKLNYAVYREQSARIGRFLMADPDQSGTDPQGLNRYAYVSNDPVGNSDSLGLRERKDIGGDRGQGGDGSRFAGVFGFNIHTGFRSPDNRSLPPTNMGGYGVPIGSIGLPGFQINPDEITIKREGGYGDCKCDGLPVLAKIACIISCVLTGPPVTGCNETLRRKPLQYNMCDRGDIFIREFECVGENSCCARARREFIDWCEAYGRDPKNHLQYATPIGNNMTSNIHCCGKPRRR